MLAHNKLSKVLANEFLLLEPLRPEYAVVLVVDVDAYEPAVLNQPVTAPSLEYSAGGDARQVAFNPLADLLVGGRAESDDRFLEFGSLEPLYQVNIAVWFCREVVLEHGNPDRRGVPGGFEPTVCLSVYPLSYSFSFMLELSFRGDLFILYIVEYL